MGYLDNKLAQFVAGAFDEEIQADITKHAWISGVIMALPTFGLSTIIQAANLWYMYSKICDYSGVPFSQHFWKNVKVGVISNYIGYLLCDLVVSLIPIVGNLSGLFLGKAITAGQASVFVKVLKARYGDQVRSNVSYQAGFANMVGYDGAASAAIPAQPTYYSDAQIEAARNTLAEDSRKKAIWATVWLVVSSLITYFSWNYCHTHDYEHTTQEDLWLLGETTVHHTHWGWVWWGFVFIVFAIVTLVFVYRTISKWRDYNKLKNMPLQEFRNTYF